MHFKFLHEDIAYLPSYGHTRASILLQVDSETRLEKCKTNH